MSAQLIKELRERSGAGMMDCKRALDESAGNMEAAIDWLRKKGLAQAAKKSGRVAAEGLVVVKAAGQKGAMVELNSETDFVARNDQFQTLAEAVAGYALSVDGDLERLNAHVCSIHKKPVREVIVDAVAAIGENIQLRRATSLSVSQGAVASYVHNAVKPNMGKIGILVALESAGKAEALEALGKQLAMHIAAANPSFLSASELTEAVIAREQDAAKAQTLKFLENFRVFEAGMAKYADHLKSERNYSEKQFEAKLAELMQTLPNVDELLADVARLGASEDRKEKQNAEKTKKLLDVFFQEAAFMLKKVKSYGQDQAVIERMTALKLEQFKEEAVLENQVYVIDGKSKVADVVKNAEKQAGAPVKLVGFKRFALGEGIEKAADDFAAEVARMSGTAA